MVGRGKYTEGMLAFVDKSSYKGDVDDMTAQPMGDRPKLSFYNWLLLKKGNYPSCVMDRSEALDWVHALIRAPESPVERAMSVSLKVARDLRNIMSIIDMGVPREEIIRGLVILLGEYYTYCFHWERNNMAHHHRIVAR